MALPSGTRIGPYEIADPIGSGGMGEVYRARDTRLGRNVAVKVLPSSFASDAERVRRFEQEAQAAGQVNHPNILAIYDVGSHDGSPYVVSELLDGQTLRELLTDGPLPIRKTIDYASQTALGLAAAHDRGIVHRNLKPDNLFLTPDGRVKILDFGLAKLVEPTVSGTSPSESKTILVDTQPGMVLGTVGYMSPEQVRGQPANHRSDIFGLGAVLYEMISGTRAFGGDSAVETMNAILKQDPPELSGSQHDLPPILDGIVRRCLEKQPEQRFQSASDLAFALGAISGASGSGISGLEPATERSTRGGVTVAVRAALVIVAAIIGVAVGMNLTTPELIQPIFHRLTYSRGAVGAARLSADGRTIVYSAAWGDRPVQVFSTQLGGTESRPLDLADADLHDVSATGDLAVGLERTQLSSWQSQGTLATVSLAGGRPRELADGILEADFAPDGSELAVIRGAANAPTQLEFPIGTVLRNESDGWLSHPRVSPDGARVAYILHPANEDAGMVLVADRAGNQTALSEGWVTVQGVAWSPDGDEVWFTASREGATRALHAVSLAGRERLLLRIPAVMTLQDVSADGNALITVDSLRAGMSGRGPDDIVERDLSWLDYSTPSALSDDGRSVLFTESGDGGGAEYGVFLRSLDGSPAVRLGPGFALGLSPDGEWAASAQRGAPGELTLLPTGPGVPRVIDISPIDTIGGLAWLPDGRIMVAGIEEGVGFRAYMFSEAGRDASAVVTGVSAPVVGGLPTPDGESILLMFFNEPPLIYPIGGSQGRAVPGMTADDFAIRWSPDGRFVFLRRRSDLATVERLDIETGERTAWKTVQRSDPAGLAPGFQLLLSADGESYVYGYLQRLSELYLVEGLR